MAAEPKFEVRIVTPQRIVYQGRVAAIRAPGVLGSFEVLAHHTSFLTALEIGELSIREVQKRQYFAASGGFLEVLPRGVTVIVETAERADEIDRERARQARERAHRRLTTLRLEIDIPRAEAALARALNRLKVARRVR